MNQDPPSFSEDLISQIPALELLQNTGYTYLTPYEVMEERKGRASNVILENILERQLHKLNTIHCKGEEYKFSNHNISEAIESLKNFPYDGLVRTSERVYDLLTLGKSFEETIAGDTKSFTLRYIDWLDWKNNVFHATAEFEVERRGSHATRQPDIVLFVNGIPFVVIECKSPHVKDSLEQAISQNLRNQQNHEIPDLFIYSQILLAVNKNEAKYATTGTSSKFWTTWKEENPDERQVYDAINFLFKQDARDKLFSGHFVGAKEYFGELKAEGTREVTAQDRALYSLCRPQRLIELTYRFILFDAGEKKIARYQQYFAVQRIMRRIASLDVSGKRPGGVIWHTQGSGKSLTMVMLAKAVSLEPCIENPKIVLVTDRVHLDEQINKTFDRCGKHPVKARSGSHLTALLEGNKETIITTVIHKFNAALKKRGFRNESPNIFVLVDEGHRTQYGLSHAQMRRALPNACYLGFTGTPLLKKEKSTALKFGGIIDKYTIDQAVLDNTVVPLLYEGRHVMQEVQKKTIDMWFERVSKPLTPEQKKDLKKKFSTIDRLNQAEQNIYATAYDISVHFNTNWKDTPYKGQIAAPSKLAAIKYKKYFDEFELVSSEVVISGPDTREGYEDIYEEEPNEVLAFWKRMMEKYGNENEYNRQIIEAFQKGENPEIIIVVDKLLTGFDEPRNTVLYITRHFQDHGLLQAIARVNRLYEGKEFGYILDYYGLLGDLNKAMSEYRELEGFDEEDLIGTLTNIDEEVKKLPQRHSDIWDIFKEIPNKKDEEAYEELLGDELKRHYFYERLSLFARTLGIALGTEIFITDTPEKTIKRYKNDLSFFMKLRNAVKTRYAEVVNFKEYETRIRKLVDTYVAAGEVMQITELVNIFDRERFSAEVERIENIRAKADTIAHRTQKTISERMQEDPVFYKKFSEVLEETIEANRLRRLSDAEYLNLVGDIMNKVRDRTGDKVPESLQNYDVAKAFYGVISEVLPKSKDDFTSHNLTNIPVVRDKTENYVSGPGYEISAEAAMTIDNIIRQNLVVEWILNRDVQNKMLNQIETYLYSLKDSHNIGLTFDDIDEIMGRCMQIARYRYQK